MGVPALKFIDAAPWIEAFISFFRENPKYQLHVVALQMGMKKESESYEEEGVIFHYIKSGVGIWTKTLEQLFRLHSNNDYPIYQRRFAKALDGIPLDLLLLCGAENPDYATVFLKTVCVRKIVIMQTLLNDKKRIQMKVSTEKRRSVENRILNQCRYFAVSDTNWVHYVEEINPQAVCFPFTFPTIKPVVGMQTEKQFDFVFFAGMLAKNKGTEDLVFLKIKIMSFHIMLIHGVGPHGNEFGINLTCS